MAMTPEALEALIYDRIADLADVDELDNEQIRAIAHEAAHVCAAHMPVLLERWADQRESNLSALRIRVVAQELREVLP